MSLMAHQNRRFQLTVQIPDKTKNSHLYRAINVSDYPSEYVSKGGLKTIASANCRQYSIKFHFVSTARIITRISTPVSCGSFTLSIQPEKSTIECFGNPQVVEAIPWQTVENRLAMTAQPEGNPPRTNDHIPYSWLASISAHSVSAVEMFQKENFDIGENFGWSLIEIWNHPSREKRQCANFIFLPQEQVGFSSTDIDMLRSVKRPIRLRLHVVTFLFCVI